MTRMQRRQQRWRTRRQQQLAAKPSAEDSVAGLSGSLSGQGVHGVFAKQHGLDGVRPAEGTGALLLFPRGAAVIGSNNPFMEGAALFGRKPGGTPSGEYYHRNDEQHPSRGRDAQDVPEEHLRSDAQETTTSIKSAGHVGQGAERLKCVGRAIARLAATVMVVLVVCLAFSSPAPAQTSPLGAGSTPTAPDSGSTPAPISATGSGDLATTCWTCASLQAYVDLSKGFTDKLAATLQQPMNDLFLAMAGLWVVLVGLRLGLHLATLQDFVKELVFVCIAGVLVGGLGTSLISYVYSATLSIMGGASAAVFSIAGNTQSSTGYSGLVALAANGEQAVAKVFQAADAIAAAGGLRHFGNYIYALVLVLPFFLLVVVYASQVIVAIFRAVMLGVLAPFLLMAVGFAWARGMALTGAKTVLATVLVMFACTAALSLTIYGVNSIITLDPSKLTGAAIDQFASITNPQFLVILFMGWGGTALMTEGTSLANSIAQTALTNAGAAILSGGVSAAALVMGKKGTGAAGAMNPLTAPGRILDAAGAAGKQWGAFRELATSPVKTVVDRFKNINKPDGGGS